MALKIQPLSDRVVIEAAPAEEVSSGGIILPDTVQDGTLVEGEVVAIGDGMYSASGTLIPVVVDVGDTILYNKNAHKAEHTIDGEDYILMSVNEVMSIVRDK